MVWCGSRPKADRLEARKSQKTFKSEGRTKPASQFKAARRPSPAVLLFYSGLRLIA